MPMTTIRVSRKKKTTSPGNTSRIEAERLSIDPPVAHRWTASTARGRARKRPDPAQTFTPAPRACALERTRNSANSLFVFVACYGYSVSFWTLQFVISPT